MFRNVFFGLIIVHCACVFGDTYCWEDPTEPVSCWTPGLHATCDGSVCSNNECPDTEYGEDRFSVEEGDGYPDPDDQSGAQWYASLSTGTDDTGWGRIPHSYQCYRKVFCTCIVPSEGYPNDNYVRCVRGTEKGAWKGVAFNEADQNWPCDTLGPMP
ncbi:hypothetical protein Poly41_42870 [Novipirellula artificiosorum]|uniref:Uncharacterized protein n=1 Tax=Novipirellula artificiosorum TaxID=2528016 RepID=A0A5C6DD27_9BACT|nr:hypothetical protein Poly41_42870 [Novipirellula artificiosorum]